MIQRHEYTFGPLAQHKRNRVVWWRKAEARTRPIDTLPRRLQIPHRLCIPTRAFTRALTTLCSGYPGRVVGSMIARVSHCLGFLRLISPMLLTPATPGCKPLQTWLVRSSCLCYIRSLPTDCTLMLIQRHYFLVSETSEARVATHPKRRRKQYGNYVIAPVVLALC